MFEGAYPHLFLSGSGGPEDECEAAACPRDGLRRPRPVRLSLDAWTRCRTRHYTTFLATDPSLAWVLYDTRARPRLRSYVLATSARYLPLRP